MDSVRPIVQHSPSLYLLWRTTDSFDVCSAVVIGRERAIVWDTLLHPDDMRRVPALTAGKPLSVVYSHADWDHVWGTNGLAPQEVVGHEGCLDRFNDPDDVERTLRVKQSDDKYYEAVELVPPTRTFKTRLNLELGGLTLELHHLPGHTRDCTVAFIPEHGVFLGGDACEVPFPIVYEDSPLSAWLGELERWHSDARVKTVIPSHGPVSDKNLLAKNIDYLRDLRDGHVPDVSHELAPFDAETHKANLKRARHGS